MSNSNGWDSFSTGSQIAVTIAQNLARENGSTEIEREHFLVALLQVLTYYPEQPEVEFACMLIARCGLKREEILLYANAAIEKIGEPIEQTLTFSAQSKKVLEYAAIEAHRDQAKEIGLEHLFIALVAPQKGSKLDETLAPLKLKDGEISRRLHTLRDSNENEVTITEGMQKVLDCAQAAMRATFCGRISPHHLLLGILENPDNRACEALVAANINLDELKAKIRGAIESDHENATPQKRYSKAAQRALYRAQTFASEAGFRYAAPEHLLFALLPHKVSVRESWKEKRKFGEVEELDGLWQDYNTEVLRALLISNLAVDSKSRTTPRQPQRLKAGIDHTNLFEFAIPLFISGIAIRWALRSTANNQVMDSRFWVIGGIVLLLVGIGLFAAGVQLFSKNKAFKERVLRVFISVLLGLFLGAASSGQ